MAAASSNSTEVRVGARYRLGRKIGFGSFGEIYLGKYWSNRLYLSIIDLDIVQQE